MRFSLKALLVVVVALGAAMGFYARRLSYDFTDQYFQTKHGSTYRCRGLLANGKLAYCAIHPLSFDSGRWSSGFGAGPSTREVAVRTDGLFVKGERLSMDAAVYVWTVDWTMRPVELTDEEYAQIVRGIDPSAPVWIEKVEPVIDEEFHRGPHAKYQHVDCGYKGVSAEP